MTHDIEDDNYDEALTENLERTLAALREDVQSVRRHLIFLEDKQDKHEALTSELVHLYKGAGIIGKVIAWIVGIAGGIGTMFLIWKN